MTHYLLVSNIVPRYTYRSTGIMPGRQKMRHASLTTTSEIEDSFPEDPAHRSPFAQHRLLTLLPGRYKQAHAGLHINLTFRRKRLKFTKHLIINLIKKIIYGKSY